MSLNLMIKRSGESHRSTRTYSGFRGDCDWITQDWSKLFGSAVKVTISPTFNQSKADLSFKETTTEIRCIVRQTIE